MHEHLWAALPGAAGLNDVGRENSKIRLISIDENSLLDAQRDAFGQFRYQRTVYADLMDRLAQAGAKTVAFDLQFPTNSASPTDDEKFKQALGRIPSVLSYTLTDGEMGPLAPALADAADAGFTPAYNESGPFLGQVLSDPEGRQSLVVRAVERYTGETFTPHNENYAALGATTIPLDGRGRLLMVPFETEATTALEQSAGSPGEWIDFARSVDLSDVLRLTPSELHDFFADTLVVVGPTAHGVADFIDGPRGRIPSVFATLRFIDQLLEGTAITPAPALVNIAAILLCTFLTAIAGYWFAPGIAIATVLATIIGYSILSIAVFASGLYWLDLLHVDIAILATTFVVGLYRTIIERNDRRRITVLLEKQTSPEVAHDIINEELVNPTTSLEGKRAAVTIFFSDIRGFTALAEEMSPEAIYQALNEYFEEMCSIVFKHGGYVDKFMGDALMAIFSAPNQGPDDAKHAVDAAIEQLERLQILNRGWHAVGRPTFQIGIGINTGEVVMGQVGSHERLNYTVIGDAVNVAARLQGSAEAGQIVVGETTAAEIKDAFVLEELAGVVAKGKAFPIRTFAVLGQRTSPDVIPSVRGESAASEQLFRRP